MKFYFQHSQDPRDRLGTEFNSLSFLWEQGLRQIPQPLKAWPQQACALYARIEGVSFEGQAGDPDIEQAVDFLKKLKSLTGSVASQGLAVASEAFFSAQDITTSLRARLNRFSFNDEGGEYLALREYVQKEFLPLLDNVEAWSKEYLTQQGISWEQGLLKQYRTLSPSDFGFHNALRTSSGKVVFLDFEYFGWDDPVKMVSDFLWHPAMSLTENLKRSFTDQMAGVFDDDPQFQSRLKALFPIFGLKWCLIFLNEFVAADMQRRVFARLESQDKTVIRLKQLARARALSQHIKNSYEEFPYGN